MRPPPDAQADIRVQPGEGIQQLMNALRRHMGADVAEHKRPIRLRLSLPTAQPLQIEAIVQLRHAFSRHTKGLLELPRELL